MKIELEVAENMNWRNYFRKQIGLCIYRKMIPEGEKGDKYHEVPNNLFVKALEFVNMTEQQNEELLKSLHETRQSSKRELKKVLENTTAQFTSSQKLGDVKVYNTVVIQRKLNSLEEYVIKVDKNINELTRKIDTLTENMKSK